jgi:YD repeat-containing protein
MKKLNFLPAIIIAALMLSCGGDDDETFVMPQTFLISNQTETYNGTAIENRTYEYDAANQIVKEMNTTEEITYTRNGAGKITKMSADNGFLIKETVYTYNGEGKLSEKETRNTSNNSIVNRSEYTYLSDHYQEKYYNADNELLYIYRNYYTEDHKNIAISKRFFSNSELASSNTYEYDNKKSIESMAPFSMLPTPFVNANNVISTVGRDSNDVIAYTSDTSYTFNESGFVTGSTSGGTVKTYTYIVK